MAFRHRAGAFKVGFRQQHHKLIPAQPGSRVVGTRQARQALRHAHQHLVAAAMALAVVHGLEAIQVDEGHRPRPALAPGAQELLLQHRLQLAAVEHAGQGVAVVSPDPFVRAAAIELPRGLRVNSISPTVLLEAMGSYAPYFRGYKPAAGADVALAYAKSVEGLQTGQTFHVG